MRSEAESTVLIGAEPTRSGRCRVRPWPPRARDVGRAGTGRAPPRTAATSDATSTETTTCSSCGLPAPNASSPTSSDTVNPIPPSRPTAPTSAQPRPGASAARVNRATSQVAPRMPSGLPTTRPSATPWATGSANAVASGPDAERHPGGEQREHGHGDPGGQRPPHVLPPFRERLLRQGVEPERPPGGLRRGGDDEPERDPGDRRVDAGRVDGGPRDQAEGHQQPAADPAPPDQRARTRRPSRHRRPATARRRTRCRRRR